MLYFLTLTAPDDDLETRPTARRSDPGRERRRCDAPPVPGGRVVGRSVAFRRSTPDDELGARPYQDVSRPRVERADRAPLPPGRGSFIAPRFPRHRRSNGTVAAIDDGMDNRRCAQDGDEDDTPPLRRCPLRSRIGNLPRFPRRVPARAERLQVAGFAAGGPVAATATRTRRHPVESMVGLVTSGHTTSRSEGLGPERREFDGDAASRRGELPNSAPSPAMMLRASPPVWGRRWAA